MRANRYGAGGSEYYAEANRRTAVIPLVESSEGAANFEKILRTPGITAVFLGPVDLSVAMGLKGNVNAPEVRSALLTMVEQANRAGIPVGALGLDPAFVQELFSRGLNFLAYGIDTILMYQKCCEIQQAVFGRSRAVRNSAGEPPKPFPVRQIPVLRQAKVEAFAVKQDELAGKAWIF